MGKKYYYVAVISLLALLTSIVFSSCSEKLEEPVFVKKLVCSVDMDADIEFITNSNSKLKAVNVEIPDMPEDLKLDFYDESVDKNNGYDLHCLNFGISTDNLSESGGLSVPFIFHEVIVKWDDGSETRADIGTIHIAESYEQSFSFDWRSRDETYPTDDTIAVVEEHQADEDLLITKIDIPYYDKLSKYIKDVNIAGRDASEISKENPLAIEKGKTYILGYMVDTAVPIKYGTIFIECKIIGTDKQGEEHINMFYIQGNENRNMPKWIMEQIERSSL